MPPEILLSGRAPREELDDAADGFGAQRAEKGPRTTSTLSTFAVESDETSTSPKNGLFSFTPSTRTSVWVEFVRGGRVTLPCRRPPTGRRRGRDRPKEVRDRGRPRPFHLLRPNHRRGRAQRPARFGLRVGRDDDLGRDGRRGLT